MLLDKICTMINADHDEDFNVYQKDNKIFIELEGFQFKNKAKIIIKDNIMIYKEKNTEYNYNSCDQDDLINHLYYIIENWINCYSPGSYEDDFKKFFL